MCTNMDNALTYTLLCFTYLYNSCFPLNSAPQTVIPRSFPDRSTKLAAATFTNSLKTLLKVRTLQGVKQRIEKGV